MTLVDSNVLVDILANDPAWVDWSASALEGRSSQGRLLIDEIVYAELAVKSESKKALDSALDELGVELKPSPRDALYLAGKVFGRYRSAGGRRMSVLPDFFIGAHAQVAGMPILTRDARRYRSYFPNVQLIAPDK